MDNIDQFIDYIENNLEGIQRWKIFVVSVGCTLVAIFLKDFLLKERSIYERIMKQFFKLAYLVPALKRKKEEELSKISTKLLKDMSHAINNDDYLTCLPSKGLKSEDIMEKVEKYSAYGKYKWKTGCASGTVYNYGDELTDLLSRAYSTTLWTNPLHADVFPGVRKMEAEIIRMCCDMFHGDAQTCGVVTPGGTESILLACKAYRDYAVNVKGISKPEILVPVTAHAAFDKAASLLNIQIKHVPVNPKTQRVEVAQMRKYVCRRTCMIVGSAPQFPHGVIDPIEELAKLAHQKSIPLHVDACLGGFLIAFMEEAGYPLKPFDFRLPAVTSISCDTHKYGFTPKGSSVILYKNADLRSHQFFVQTDWPGGIYATPSIAGSRPGGIIAATWAALLYHGREGYVESTKAIIITAKYIANEIKMIPGLEVVGEPEVSVVAFTSSKFSIYTVSDAMNEKGWNLNILQFPSCIHIAVTFLHTMNSIAENLIRDLREISTEMLKNPYEPIDGSAALYGMAQRIPDRSLIDEIGKQYLDCIYETTIVA